MRLLMPKSLMHPDQQHFAAEHIILVHVKYLNILSFEQTWGVSAWHCKQLICIWLWQYMFAEALPASIYCLACYSFREQLHLHIRIIDRSILLSSLSRRKLSRVQHASCQVVGLLMVHILPQTDKKYSRVCCYCLLSSTVHGSWYHCWTRWLIWLIYHDQQTCTATQ